MRAVVLAGLILVAATIGLWVSLSSDPEAAVVSDHHETKVATPTPEARPAPVAPRSATIPKATTSRAVPQPIEHAPAGPAPTVDTQGSGSDAKPVDPFREELFDQVRNTEGAVADCVDAVKKTAPLPNGDASYGFYLGRQNGKVVVEKITTEYGPFPAAFNDCVAKSASGVAVDALPANMQHVAVFRGVRITNGELKRNTLLNYEIVDSVPN